jgi:hypothetical protein
MYNHKLIYFDVECSRYNLNKTLWGQGTFGCPQMVLQYWVQGAPLEPPLEYAKRYMWPKSTPRQPPSPPSPSPPQKKNKRKKKVTCSSRRGTRTTERSYKCNGTTKIYQKALFMVSKLFNIPNLEKSKVSESSFQSSIFSKSVCFMFRSF